jgi:hypothetical protein
MSAKSRSKAKARAESRVNEAGNYTKPGLRKSIFNRIKAGRQALRQGLFSIYDNEAVPSDLVYRALPDLILALYILPVTPTVYLWMPRYIKGHFAHGLSPLGQQKEPVLIGQTCSDSL